MKIFDQRAAKVILTVLLFAGVLAFLWLSWRTLIAFIFAVFFAYLLESPVEYFGRRFNKHARAKGILITYLGIFGTLIILFAIFGGHIATELQNLSQQLPGLSERLGNGELVHSLGAQRGWSFETEERVRVFLQTHHGQIISTVETYVNHALMTVENMWWLLLVPILAIFFLKDGRKFRDDILAQFPQPHQRRVLSILIAELNEMLGHFMRAQVALSAIAMAVITLGLAVLRVPYSFALGPIAGALEFIPVVGPIIGGIIVLGVGFAANAPHLLAVLIFLLVWRGIQDYVNSPRLLGGKLELHPLAVLFGVLAGGEVGGVIGVFLSIPILAACKIAWRTYHQYRQGGLPPAVQSTRPEMATLRS
jgi:predicted PurR-regulated permease PerM